MPLALSRETSQQMVAVYNQAIQDAQAYFQEKTVDLDGSCYQPERTYWKSK